MRRLALTILSICLLFACLTSAGCGRQGKTWYRVFAAPFEAELQGEWHDVKFEACYRSDSEGATLTFYAPTTLAGTALKRGQDGRVTANAGDISFEVTGFNDLFALFPTADNTQKATVTPEGHTRLCGDNFFVEFLPGGAPYRVGYGNVTATVIRFKSLDETG